MWCILGIAKALTEGDDSEKAAAAAKKAKINKKKEIYILKFTNFFFSKSDLKLISIKNVGL